MAIEIVDLSIERAGSFQFVVFIYQRVTIINHYDNHYYPFFTIH